MPEDVVTALIGPLIGAALLPLGLVRGWDLVRDIIR